MSKLPGVQKWRILLAIPLRLIYYLTYKEINKTVTIIEIALLILNSSQIERSFILDYLATSIVRVVAFISINVLIFSNYYLADSDEKKFYRILIIFILSIIIFSTSHNLISLLLGWDGLGISRFILVAHYPTHRAAGRRIVTIFTNRLGDGFLIIRFYFYIAQGRWNLTQLLPPSIAGGVILIIMAAATKRAHIPFNLWLPEAIAAPTPVSALVHSSTLVTAGIILIIRTSLHTPCKILPIIWVIGTLTTLIAGAVASYIDDPKKIIAYSTIRQLGIISIALGINMPTISLFHLITHAIFKALIFISMGIIIAQIKHKQIIISNQNTLWSSPRTHFKLASIALNAFPFTAGFFSKDLILEYTICYWSERFRTLIFTPIALTALYSLRLIKLTSSIKMNSSRGRTTNSTSKSYRNFSSGLLQSLGAILTGSLMRSLHLNERLHFIIPQQTLIILIMTIIGITILTINQTNTKHITKIIKLITYTNFSLWWVLEKFNLIGFFNSLHLYKTIEKAHLTIYATSLYSTLNIGSRISHTTNYKIKTIITLAVISISPLLIL